MLAPAPFDDERSVRRVLGDRARPGDFADIAVAVEESQGLFDICQERRRRRPAAAGDSRQDDRQDDPI